jgi:hypothetical protein
VRVALSLSRARLADVERTVPAVPTGMEAILPENRIYIPKVGKLVRLAVGEPFDLDALLAHHAHHGSTDARTRAHIADVIEMKLADLHHRLVHHPGSLD